jgi:hypothetical protein
LYFHRIEEKGNNDHINGLIAYASMVPLIRIVIPKAKPRENKYTAPKMIIKPELIVKTRIRKIINNNP